jgi:hypothetical protein
MSDDGCWNVVVSSAASCLRNNPNPDLIDLRVGVVALVWSRLHRPLRVYLKEVKYQHEKDKKATKKKKKKKKKRGIDKGWFANQIYN